MIRRVRPAMACLSVLATTACSSSTSAPMDAAAEDAGHSPKPDAAATRDARSVDAAHAVEAAHGGDAAHSRDAHVADVAERVPDAPASGDSGKAPDAGPADTGATGYSLATLGACLGTAATLTVSGQMPFLDVPVGSESGEFVMDFGSTFSSIDLSVFASPGPSTSGCDSSDLGEVCTVAGFDFFGVTGSVELTTESYAEPEGTVVQAGIVGTDLLSEHVITVDYTGAKAYAAASGSSCSANALAAAGFVPLSAAGFYENDLSSLKPASDVESGAPSGESVPNVPTVPIAIAGVGAVAQLDTGFDDDVTPFSVDINQAFYSAIVAAHPSALVRDSSADETLTTCVSGVSESAEAYRLASGTTFDFVGTSGAAARKYSQAVIFVKQDPAAASSCGGIGTWTAPAAQVGASFYVDMGALVLDPFRAMVWIPASG